MVEEGEPEGEPVFQQVHGLGPPRVHGRLHDLAQLSAQLHAAALESYCLGTGEEDEKAGT